MGLLNRTEEPPAEETSALTVDVTPAEIPELQQAAEALAKARRWADQLPAECNAENKSQFADALKTLRDAKRDAEDARKKITRQFDDGKKRVKAHVDELVSSCLAAYESTEDRLLAHEAAERKAAEEEREAEERQRREEQEAEDRRAQEEQRVSKYVPPPPPRKRPTGARGSTGAKASPTKTLKYKIVDESKVPEAYWRKELDRSKIQADVRAGVHIDGVEPYYDESVRVG